MRSVRLWVLVTWLGLPFVPICAQSIENVQAVVNADRVTITYDLIGSADRKYNISLYSSHNNFASPLRLVSGAIGEGQSAGRSKVVEWKLGEELVTYTGQIVFRLRGEVMSAALSVQSPSANSVIKLGKKTEITWTGGKGNQIVRIDLLEDGRTVATINESTNTGSFNWNVPKDLEKGNYQVRLTSGSDSSQPVPVQIKAPLPLWLKLSPLVIVGAGVFFLMPGEKPPPPPADLPNAPRPN